MALLSGALFGALRQTLLVGYDHRQPPQNVTVEIGLNLYQIERVDIKTSTSHLHAWLRMAWRDSRLQWDPSAHGGVDELSMLGAPHSDEEEVWVPDVELYNGKESIYFKENKHVTVSSDGSCFWSRPMRISSICEMEGLENFPFDEITCRLHFGGWALSDRFQNLTLYDPAWDTEHVPDMHFQEYFLEGVTASSGVDTYACCPDGWPYVDFSIRMSRAVPYYVYKVVMINFFLTIVSFGAFFVSPHTGERVSFSITMLLTLIASDFVVSGFLPVCAPFLWIEIFTMLSLSFCFLSLVQTIAVVSILHTHGGLAGILTPCPRLKRMAPSSATEASDTSTTILIRRTFTSLDIDDRGFLMKNVSRRFFREFGEHPENDGDANGDDCITLSEFADACMKMIEHSGMDEFERVLNEFLAIEEKARVRLRQHRMLLADAVDRASRLIFPAVYCALAATLFGVRI